MNMNKLNMNLILGFGGAVIAGISIGMAIPDLSNKIASGSWSSLIGLVLVAIFTLFFAYPAFREIGIERALKNNKLNVPADITDPVEIRRKQSEIYGSEPNLYAWWMLAWFVVCLVAMLLYLCWSH